MAKNGSSSGPPAGGYLAAQFAANQSAIGAANIALGNNFSAANAEQLEAMLAAKEKLKKLEEDYLRVVQRGRQVESGAYANQLAAIDKYQRKLADVERMERRVQLVRKYGAAGATAAQLAGSPAARAATSVAGSAYSAGRGLVSQGMAGTVEMNRMQMEQMLIAREMAGTFKPALDEATAGLTGFRRFLQSMNGDQQKLVMQIGLTVAGFVALNKLGLGGTVLGGLGSVVRGAGPLGVAAAAIAAAPDASVDSEGYSAAVRASPWLRDQSKERLAAMAAEARKGETWLGRRFNNTVLEGGFGSLADAGAWMGRRVGLDLRRDSYKATSTQLEELAAGQGLGTRPRAKTGTTLPGGDLNELGSTFYEVMKASGSRGVTGETTETYLGQILEVITKYVENKPPPVPGG